MEAGALRGVGVSAQPKDLPASEHAQRLHAMAEDLASLNSRIGNFLNRMAGPVPESAGTAEKQPEPQGVLYVAQFGATRIGNGIERLRELTARLESIA